MLKNNFFLRGLALLLCLSLLLGLVPGGILGGITKVSAESTTLSSSDITDVVDTYPRLYLNAEELAAMRTHVNDTEKNAYGFTWKSQYDSLISQADAYLIEETVVQRSNYGTSVTMQLQPVLTDPNDPSYDQMYIAASKDENGVLVEEPHLGFGSGLTDTMRARLETLSLAYALTGDTRYSALAISYAVQMCGWAFWGDWDWLNIYGKGHYAADASNAWAMQGVAAVYDMCYDQLTTEQKSTIETGIINLGLEPLRQQIIKNPYSIQNASMMYIGGTLTGLAAILNDDNIDDLQPLTIAYTGLSDFKCSITSTILELSEIAPNGQFSMHAPQRIHFSSSIRTLIFSSILMASTGQDFLQGLCKSAMAL